MCYGINLVDIIITKGKSLSHLQVAMNSSDVADTKHESLDHASSDSATHSPIQLPNPPVDSEPQHVVPSPKLSAKAERDVAEVVPVAKETATVKKTKIVEQEQPHESDEESDDSTETVAPKASTAKGAKKSAKIEKKTAKEVPVPATATVNSAPVTAGTNTSTPITASTNTSTPTPQTPVPAEPQVEKFAELSYMEVQINLRFLGDLKEGEKVMISDNKFMQVDQRYVQAARRWWTSDSRARTLNFISHLIESAKKYCTEAVEKVKLNDQKQINLEKLINIQKLLGNALTGLGRMVTTYGDDKLNLATIETFKSTITVFCDQDLKRAITDQE